MMKVSDFIQLLEEGTKTESGYSALCPSHDDHNPSLSVNEGKILLTCHAGCTVEEICHSLKIQVSDLFSEPRKESTTQKRKIQETYNLR